MKARENPFTAERVIATIRYACPDGGLDALVARLAPLGYRAAIVGPHGAGKTTLLEDLGRALQDRGFRVVSVRLATDDRRLPGAWPSRAARLGPRDIVCLDGAEQLSAIRWLGFRWRARRAGGLIVTSHARGRLPLLIECTTNADLLDRIVRRLSPAPAAGAPSAAELFGRHHGNLRDALRELYDFHANSTDYRQVLVSSAIDPNQEAPRPGLMKTLSASMGSDATFAQKAAHTPLGRKYISTFET